MTRHITIKPSLLNDIIALPQKEARQINTKIHQLMQDPMPDGKTKKHLKHIPGKFHRLRCGDYRVIYTYNEHSLGIIAIRRRNESTYDDDDLDIDLSDEQDAQPEYVIHKPHETVVPPTPTWESAPNQDTSKRLPEPMTVDLLAQLSVPPEYYRRLQFVRTQDELLACPGIDAEILLRIDQYMFDLPLAQRVTQPDLIVNEVQDLLRYKEGELLAFLLKLSPEQEKYVNWSLKATGPALVKGGPGTGKSTVALYRIRSLLQQLLAQKTLDGMGEEPKILFTTYTNALVRSSEQLLQQLLGDDARYVLVATADKIARDILYEQGLVKELLSPFEQQKLLRQAIAETPLEGSHAQQAAQQQTLERMGHEYLLQEITGVIIARQIPTLAAYQAASRSGRKLRLSISQRGLVWRIYERWQTFAEASKKETWQQQRARAAQQVTSSDYFHRFDAVIIDEAQDLDPSLLRLLIQLCKAPNRLFITADANQSIYGSGFSWSDVHQSLKFQGRTSILRTNFRSTREIGDAAQAYLIYHGTHDLLDDEGSDYHYVHEGPIPDVRIVMNRLQEAQLLARFFKQAITHLRLTLGSCAILCPSENAGNGLVAALGQQGIEAVYMAGRELNLTQPGVKVITLKSSKGLEFPIVALAGFVGSSYPIIPQHASEEERDEILSQERRNMFVGMTRAMRSLLVVIPKDNESQLFQGFDERYWNMQRKM
ncbi:MAG: 3'-5' exonuclease [Ktedonobacteraceae bacterium]